MRTPYIFNGYYQSPGGSNWKTVIILFLFFVCIIGVMQCHGQLGDSTENVQHHLACSGLQYSLHTDTDYIIQTTKDELLVYNFSKKICTSIVLIGKKDSQVYTELLNCFYIQQGNSSGTKIEFYPDMVIYKLFITGYEEEDSNSQAMVKGKPDR